MHTYMSEKYNGNMHTDKQAYAKCPQLNMFSSNIEINTGTGLSHVYTKFFCVWGVIKLTDC